MKIKEYNIEQLEELAVKIRDKILDTVSENGGHLSSPLGAVDLIIAMHYVFDVEKDPFIFDVSHQAYAHKLLTDRWDDFETLRKIGGIAGFTKPEESKYDYFVAGHSSTSVSLAVGAAKSINLKKEDRIPIALIGDGSVSSGMVFEAMNELGDKQYPSIIILNDNEMSISKPIGALSKNLSKLLAGKFYQNFRAKTDNLLKNIGEPVAYLGKTVEKSFHLITPGKLFEELGLQYVGPVDGHDIKSLIDVMKFAKELQKPVIIHAQTIKGKGYKKAEGHLESWHGVGPFDLESGKSIKKSSAENATSIYSRSLLQEAEKNENIVGVTAAMPSGTGLTKLMEKYPDRFFDVAIAEQHAVTSCAAMAKEGLKPFCTIYSTFLQRAYDQIVHDVCLMDLPVVFAIDRAGLVGEDGPTHHGVFDISYLRHIPNMILFAPRDDSSMEDAVRFASKLESPCAFRYPRGSFLDRGEFEFQEFELGKSQLLKEGEEDILFIGYGNGVGRAIQTIEVLGRDIGLLDLRFVKPLDEGMLEKLSGKYKKWFVFSDSAKMGGVGSALLEFLSKKDIKDVKLTSFEYDDGFVGHGNVGRLEEELGLTPGMLANLISNN